MKIKCITHSYALSAKGHWVGMASMANNQMIKRNIEDVLLEKIAVCKENLDYSFHLKYY